MTTLKKLLEAATAKNDPIKVGHVNILDWWFPLPTYQKERHNLLPKLRKVKIHLYNAFI